MESKSAFTNTEPSLQPILDELVKLEPIFHTTGFGTSAADFERRTAPKYWEVGASGRRYSRQFILGELSVRPLSDAADLGWKSFDHAVIRLGSQTYLMTYVLLQGERLTRRATIWERASDDWRVIYHQGTEVSVDEDDVAPSQEA